MKKIFLLLMCLCAFVTAQANISPKPEMEFSFIYNTEEKPLIDPAHSEQIQCTDNQCLQAQPLGHYGMQKLYCSPGSCFSIAYEYQDYQKLVLAFTDGTVRESNIFQTPNTLRARLNVYIDKDKLTVEPTDVIPDSGSWARTDAWVSLILILLLEIAAAVGYLWYTQKSFVILYSVVLANIITTAVSWLFLAWYVPETTILWLFCLFLETFLIRLMNLKRISLKDAFILCLAINVTSYSVGMILSFMLAPLLF